MTSVTAMKKDAPECPLFLRKTYHMVDTCEPAIACWSDDGETFVVKDTQKFEKTIIPQFFKHSKFSSFVRQLNFYGFRKIKYADTIKIDMKLEAETANFWRFRHDKFQRGKPELLVEIKRSNGQQPPVPNTVPSAAKTEDSAALKSEVTTLKKRIENMSKNIDELTTLVQKVSLKQTEEETKHLAENNAPIGTKRKKMELVKDSDVRPDEALSRPMELEEEFPLLPPSLFSTSLTPKKEPLRREESETSQLTDTDFVDQLFTAFGDEDSSSSSLQDVAVKTENAPDPALMKSLSDALALLPKDMQELIVNRLIATITGTEFLEKQTTNESQANQEPSSPTEVVPPSPVLGGKAAASPEVSLPLAAATLAAILSHYGGSLKEKPALQKALPQAIPMHA